MVGAFAVGAFANGIGYGLNKGIIKIKARKFSTLSKKAKSAKIWEMKGIDPSTLSKEQRNMYKDITDEQLEEIIIETSNWLRNGKLSSITSSGLSSLLW